MPTAAALPPRLRRAFAPAAIPLPPWRGARPLKRWRYVGLYGPDLMLCAASVRIAGLPQAFWAIWDGSDLRDATVFAPGAVAVRDGVLRAGPARLRWLPDGEPVETTSRHGSAWIWTRKQPIRAEGTVGDRRVEMRGLVDDSAGHHARETAWRWCAGVGVSAAGAPLAWNVCTGMHDGALASERTLWVGGAARELPAPSEIATGLDAVRWPDGAILRFGEQARRARRDDFGLLASDYAQPFGTFSGTLPGGVDVARGWGVMERHTARW
ncbi:MAG TPA: DUF2804 family protein [Baekduia sp.]|nr:DUF2804 family protein [Baekduia sp.]